MLPDRTEEESIRGHILREYHGLEDSLRSLGGLTVKQRRADAAGVTTGPVDEHLRRVRQHMERLFEYEESGGLHDDLLALLPAESPRVEALKEEHAALLARINALIAGLEEHDVTELKALRAELRSFVRALESHEHRERSLLQRPYYSEEGTSD